MGAELALLSVVFDELSAATAAFAAAFFGFELAVLDATRSFMLVFEFSERVSSRTRGLAGGILFVVTRDQGFCCYWIILVELSTSVSNEILFVAAEYHENTSDTPLAFPNTGER